MGYILPITQFQYSDYQKRMLEDKQDLHNIEKPYKVFLDMEQKSDYDRKTHYEHSKNERQTFYTSTTPPKQTRSDPLYAKITGKGSLFNKSV